MVNDIIGEKLRPRRGIKMYKYNVSVVMAVYNVEPFIREAIDSVIEQDIGFRNIQLILVNDGSPDGSGAICDEYAAKYPENIVVVHKENGGVSSARNAGLDLVEGEFVNFMDPDDRLDKNTISVVYRFFKKHEDEIDVVTIPMKYFDGKKGNYTMNYVFNEGTRIIDLESEWDHIQSSASSAFFKNLCFENHRFDTRLPNSEDTKLLNLFLLAKRKYGVVHDVVYWYRRRSTGAESAVQSAKKEKPWYMNFMRYYQKEMVDYCLESYQSVPRFIQFVLMYGLQWKISLENKPSDILTDEESQEYFALISSVLQYIEDDVIDAQRNINQEHKLLAYRLKYGDALVRIVLQDDICIITQNEIRVRASQFPLTMEFYSNTEDSCEIACRLGVLTGMLGDCKILAKAGGEFYEAYAYGARKPTICLDEEIVNPLTFKVSVPLKKMEPYKLEFYCETESIRIPLHKICYGRFFPVSARYTYNFYANYGWILTCHEHGLCLKPQRLGDFVCHEAALCLELLRTRKAIPCNAVIARMMLHLLKPFKRKPLWLISDRASKAGDNGEAFFCYVRENHPEVDARFVLNRHSSDYESMKKIGPVVRKDSYFHKLLHLLSDCVISSQAGRDISNPFYQSPEPYRNMLTDAKIVFLQHGITGNDISQWIGRFNQNLSGFVTAALPEHEAILKGAYEYTDNEVWLTGFPRFDRLYRDSQKWITIMPTWRRYLMGQLDSHSGTWSLLPGVEKSEYIQFYNGLLNSRRLHEAAEKYGYVLKFLPHPNLQDHLNLFEPNNSVAYLSKSTEYREIYAKSDLLVTDYSSAVFDFAYLRKPVLYTQFDSEDFFSGKHSVSRGYFDYERDGFGEVEYDLDSTIDRIIEYMENGCQLKEKYGKRIEKFFAFNDQNNCQRVFDKIMELQKNV